MQTNIDVKQIENIKNQLDSLNNEDVLFVNEDGQTKYAIIPIASYDLVEEMLSSNLNEAPKVILAGDKTELTYEEYERVKGAIMDLVEQTLKPKAEKLN